MSSELSHVASSSVAPEVFDSDQPQSWQSKWRELVKYRYLLRNLVIRDLKARYKNSVLGILWSLLNPLLMMAVYTVLFTILIPNDNIHHYPVFILVALIPWNFFNGSLIAGTVSITNNAPLLKKVYFPRILLPMAALLSSFVNFLLSLVVLVVFLFIFDIGITIHALWVPAILVTQIVFTLGICLLLSTLHTFYRDVLMILEVGMLAWFFLTPVFYPFEWITEKALLMDIPFNAARVMRWLNPMASIVDGYRTVLWGNLGSAAPGSMDPLALLRTFVTAVLVFMVGYAVFARSEHLFGEKL
jgi:lipopolysaccharide transport system permease protein